MAIQQVNEIVDLGHIFDRRLSYRNYIASAIIKGNLIIGFIRRRFKQIKNKEVALLLYKGLVLPVIEYGAVIWSPSTITDTGLLDQIQRKMTRFLLKMPPNITSASYIDYHQRLRILDLMKLKERRKIRRIIMMI